MNSASMDELREITSLQNLEPCHFGLFSLLSMVKASWWRRYNPYYWTLCSISIFPNILCSLELSKVKSTMHHRSSSCKRAVALEQVPGLKLLCSACVPHLLKRHKHVETTAHKLPQASAKKIVSLMAINSKTLSDLSAHLLHEVVTRHPLDFQPPNSLLVRTWIQI